MPRGDAGREQLPRAASITVRRVPRRPGARQLELQLAGFITWTYVGACARYSSQRLLGLTLTPTQFYSIPIPELNRRPAAPCPALNAAPRVRCRTSS